MQTTVGSGNYLLWAGDIHVDCIFSVNLSNSQCQFIKFSSKIHFSIANSTITLQITT